MIPSGVVISPALILELRPLGAGAKNRLFPDVALGLGGKMSAFPKRISEVTAGTFITSFSPGTGVCSNERSRSGDALKPIPGERTDSITATLAWRVMLILRGIEAC